MLFGADSGYKKAMFYLSCSGFFRATCFSLVVVLLLSSGCRHAGVVAETKLSAPEGVIEAKGEQSAPYLLQAGDEVNIQVFREPELSGKFLLSADGGIRHSLLGNVHLGGLSLMDAEAQMTSLLAENYLVSPSVMVSMESTRRDQVLLLGEVKKPGSYPMLSGERLTLIGAIAGAGGFTDLASPNRVRIVRLVDGHPSTLRVRVADVMEGKGKERDIVLAPNDVITVPEVWF